MFQGAYVSLENRKSKKTLRIRIFEKISADLRITFSGITFSGKTSGIM